MAKQKKQPEKHSHRKSSPIRSSSAAVFILFGIRFLALFSSLVRKPVKVVVTPILILFCGWLVVGLGVYSYQYVQYTTLREKNIASHQQLDQENLQWETLRKAHPTARDVVLQQLSIAYQQGKTVDLLRNKEDLLKIDPNSATVSAALSKLNEQ